MSQDPTSPTNKYFQTDHLTDAIGGRTARGGFVTMVTHGLKFAVSIVATAILARLLTPEDYGLIGMVAVAAQFVAMFKDIGLALATIQRDEILCVERDRLYLDDARLRCGDRSGGLWHSLLGACR